MGMTEIVKAETQELARPDPMVMLAQMVESGANPEAMKVVAELARTFKVQKDEEEFSRRLQEFKLKCPVIERKKQVCTNTGRPMYKTAPIEDIQAIVDPILLELGLSYDFDAKFVDPMVEVVCRVRYGSYTRESKSIAPEPKEIRQINDAQRIGWAETHAKRRALCAALGIRLIDADENEMARAEVAMETITEQQAAGLQELIEESGRTREAVLRMASSMSGRKIEKLSDITVSQYQWLRTSLSKKGQQ